MNLKTNNYRVKRLLILGICQILNSCLKLFGTKEGSYAVQYNERKPTKNVAHTGLKKCLSNSCID